MRKGLRITMLAMTVLSSSIATANPPVIHSVSGRLFTEDFVNGFGRSVGIDADIAVIGATEGGTFIIRRAPSAARAPWLECRKPIRSSPRECGRWHSTAPIAG
jgi:hypothetical protein